MLIILCSKDHNYTILLFYRSVFFVYTVQYRHSNFQHFIAYTYNNNNKTIVVVVVVLRWHFKNFALFYKGKLG